MAVARRVDRVGLADLDDDFLVTILLIIAKLYANVSGLLNAVSMAVNLVAGRVELLWLTNSRDLNH